MARIEERKTTPIKLVYDGPVIVSARVGDTELPLTDILGIRVDFRSFSEETVTVEFVGRVTIERDAT